MVEVLEGPIINQRCFVLLLDSESAILFEYDHANYVIWVHINTDNREFALIVFRAFIRRQLKEVT